VAIKKGVDVVKLAEELMEAIRNPQVHPMVKQAAGASLAKINWGYPKDFKGDEWPENYDPIIEAEARMEMERENDAIYGHPWRQKIKEWHGRQ
jgi:hypothetical protein